jgi:hypothetical protein
VQTWRFYNSRAEIENRIKELKDDFAADGFCLQSFYGTEAAFRLICFLFNLVTEFKREVIQDEAPRLSTLRTKVLVIGAIMGREGRHPLLRLGLRDRWRQHFALLLERIASSRFQMWRSSPTTCKTLGSGRGNRAVQPGYSALALVPN